MHKNPTHKLLLHLPPELYALLRAMAESRGTSVTVQIVQACQDAVQEYVDEVNSELPIETGSENGQ